MKTSSRPESRPDLFSSLSLFYVTDRQRTRYPLARVTSEAVAGGVNVIILRERDLGSSAYRVLATTLQGQTQDCGTSLFLTNRIQLVQELGLPGIHLSQMGPEPSVAREVLGPDVWIGLSVHAVDDLVDERLRHLDYLIAAPVYETNSKPGRTSLGEEGLAAICRRTALPVLALGGIGLDQVAKVVATGVRGVAVIGAISETWDTRAATERLTRKLAEIGNSPAVC